MRTSYLLVYIAVGVSLMGLINIFLSNTQYPYMVNLIAIAISLAYIGGYVTFRVISGLMQAGKFFKIVESRFGISMPLWMKLRRYTRSWIASVERLR